MLNIYIQHFETFVTNCKFIAMKTVKLFHLSQCRNSNQNFEVWSWRVCCAAISLKKMNSSVEENHDIGVAAKGCTRKRTNSLHDIVCWQFSVNNSIIQGDWIQTIIRNMNMLSNCSQSLLIYETWCTANIYRCVFISYICTPARWKVYGQPHAISPATCCGFPTKHIKYSATLSFLANDFPRFSI